MASSDTSGERRKKEKSQRALLADGEKCCKLTDLFLKSSAASASTCANTASTNVSDTAEPAHQGERQDREEYEREKEQSFSTLKFIKDCLRTRLSRNNLEVLMLMIFHSK